MSAHVLMYLLKQVWEKGSQAFYCFFTSLGKGKPSILLLFHNGFNKLNNTGGQILDSVYHMI